MRILVTGGAGFIGAYVSRALVERGDAVTLIDNFNDYYDPRLKRARVAALLGDRVDIRVLDVADAEAVLAVWRTVRPDGVLHLAAWAGVRPSREHPALYTAANVLGTVNVFEACARVGVPTVVFASSSTVYGPDAPVPSPEDAAGSDQRSAYGVSKRAAELYAGLYHRLTGMAITGVRYFTAYGPWGRPDMALWRFTERILRGEPVSVYRRAKDGREVRRGFTHIDDIVRGTVSALDRKHANAIVNLGHDDSVPLARFITAIEAATAKKARVEERVLPDEEEIQTGADLRHARELLGYAPTVNIEDGVRTFVEWYTTEFQQQFAHGLTPSRFWQ